MNKIGILAYGSLIEDPGVEIEPLIHSRICDVETPFSIEFARTSSYRNGAPTVVPVSEGGNPVKATILVLKNEVSSEKAADLIWRRETRNETSKKHYKKPQKLSINQVVVEVVKGLSNVECVLYTKICANIEKPTPKKLAELAIKSAKEQAGKNSKDGISYLISLKRQNIETPLMAEYEKAILQMVGVSKIEEALRVVREKYNPEGRARNKQMSSDVQKAYDERYVRWAATSRNQLSFLNNLLLTLSIVFLTLIFKDKNYSTYFTLKNPDLDLTLSVLSLIAVLISISFGFITALNRLWDFRITSRITMIRKGMYKHSTTQLDESSSEKYGFGQLLSMYWKLLMESYPDISIEQCKEFDKSCNYEKRKIRDNFKELRTISHNLGLKTWRNLKIQMLTFMISAILFVLSIIL